MTLRRGDASVTVWRGDYPFGRDSSFFPKAAAMASKYANREPSQRPPEAQFREELEALRETGSLEGQVLLDQLEHRWRHPDCPPALYVLTCTLVAPEGGALVDANGEHVQELVCTKVGEAKRTIAARLSRYRREVLGGVPIAEGSLNLRAVIYGDGMAMLMERDVQEVARNAAPRAQKISDGRVVGYVGDETYVGLEVVNALYAFARQRGHR